MPRPFPAKTLQQKTACGVAGGLVALWIMDTPFGFMAFLGIISLVGLIVSHIIVLFDFIEEKHAEGEPLKEAVLDAGIMRLRPVMITVGNARRPAVGTNVLRADGRDDGSDLYHFAVGTGDLFDLRTRSQTH